MKKLLLIFWSLFVIANLECYIYEFTNEVADKDFDVEIGREACGPLKGYIKNTLTLKSNCALKSIKLYHNKKLVKTYKTRAFAGSIIIKILKNKDPEIKSDYAFDMIAKPGFGKIQKIVR